MKKAAPVMTGWVPGIKVSGNRKLSLKFKYCFKICAVGFLAVRTVEEKFLRLCV